MRGQGGKTVWVGESKGTREDRDSRWGGGQGREMGETQRERAGEERLEKQRWGTGGQEGGQAGGR